MIINVWNHRQTLGCLNNPPKNGASVALPAGGQFTVELAHNQAQTSLSYNGAHASEWPDGQSHPEDWRGPGNPPDCIQDDGAMQAHDQATRGGHRLGKVSMENLVVLSMLEHTPWKRLATYKVPRDLPECPPGGCYCAWLWVPDGCGQPNMYMANYRCHVTNSTSNRRLAAANAPVYCKDDQSKCVAGAKQMIAWNQKEGNNFDLCDENRHFQLVVPIKARKHPHLLNAIFAVSARHLSRLPQYKTPQGILYQGQLLTQLGNNDAVEYMLKCIPAFRRFHENEDDDFRESIIATAVILRQLEEIDDEDEDADDDDDYHVTGVDGHLHEKQINFMPIINAVLRDPASQAMFGHRSLIQAAYWFALRQEIYHSFTRRKPPQLDLPPEYWQGASNVNKSVMHTVQVAKWHWGRGTDDEFLRLMDQQSFLEHTVLTNTKPLFEKPADKRQGEIFPTIWYTSHIELTSIQQSLMARSVLVSENPFLKQQPSSRSSWRKVENEVRMLMLDLCGIALCHPACAPALVNAAIGIQLYGDYFTDQYERLALRSVVEKYRDAHAWPVRRLLEMFTT
ncbi:hypothetical protein ISF_06343 [Cordyceps fumosorosea ARSEF 2679]|uniref:ARCA-like protein n=1 Tax=Cordyceps fumosorosea (strain ARSEF 2679) TaxID=1081104 RepID=A0A167S9W0_CORFA|nr:hypothetical protein ISF_06343 [Cordyceps fumosorosea ARSEF 2679]OAA59408.1 hypothetical protein ISF_06343 [Cordyceps fumosorosea ARSEF 2679]